MTTIANVDAKEIEKFSRLADDWWDNDGALKTLHAINPLRLQYIRQHTHLAKQQVLDVGCGGGILSESLARLDAKVTAIDMSAEALAVAAAHQQNLKIDYQQQSAEDFALQYPATFDIVVCMELLEHVPDPSAIVAACASLVKPQGYVFFSTINRNIKAYLHSIIAAEYVLGLLPQGTHDYQKFIRPSELSAWARKSQLSLQDLCGVIYQPISRQFQLSTTVDVNYMACFQPNVAHN